MGFTDFLFPALTPLYPPAATVLTYLEPYSDHFNLRPHIHFNTSVISAEYTLNEVSPSGKKVYAWNVSTQFVADSEQQINRFKLDWLLVCNGHFSIPRYPSIPGLSTWVASGKVSFKHIPQPLPTSPSKALVIGGGQLHSTNDTLLFWTQSGADSNYAIADGQLCFMEDPNEK